MHQNGLSGAYIGFETCQIQQCWFWVSMISSSWKIKISKEKSSIKWGEKTIKMEWDLCSNAPWAQFCPYTRSQNHISKPSSQKSRKNHHNSESLVTQNSNLGPILPLHQVSEPYIKPSLSKIKKKPCADNSESLLKHFFPYVQNDIF